MLPIPLIRGSILPLENSFDVKKANTPLYLIAKHGLNSTAINWDFLIYENRDEGILFFMHVHTYSHTWLVSGHTFWDS